MLFRPFPRFAAVAFGVWFAALPVAAQQAATSDDLFQAMQLPQIIAVMREEGLDYGQELADQMLAGGASADWADAVSTIYDADRMTAEVQNAFDEALAGQDLTQMVAFFASEPGATIVTLEVSARRAMLDDEVETAAKELAAVAIGDATPRYQLIDRFAQTNDLIETNVISAMNSNIAYYMGLMQGGAMGGDVTESQLLSDVYGREDEIRSNTTEWVYSFLLLAYDPLSDADLEAYIAFSQTPAGQALNRGLFVAFEKTFEDISRALGQATAQFMVTQEL